MKPIKKGRKQPVKLTINALALANAERLAYARQMSLSDFTESLIEDDFEWFRESGDQISVVR